MHACMQQMGRLESWDETDSWFGIQVSIPITWVFTLLLAADMILRKYMDNAGVLKSVHLRKMDPRLYRQFLSDS